jgi:hypothetical protein
MTLSFIVMPLVFGLPFTLLFAPFTLSDEPECGPGIRMYWGGVYQRTYEECSFDSASYSGTQRISADGSYVACSSSTHQFWFWAETYFPSSGTLYLKFIFDKSNSGFPGDSSESRAYESSFIKPAWTSPVFLLIHDFRYSIRLEVNDSYAYQRVNVDVDIAGSGLHVLSIADGLEDCYRVGCRDPMVDRLAFSCQPSPSNTRSPRSPTSSATSSPSSSPLFTAGSHSPHFRRHSLIVRLSVFDFFLQYL